MDMEFWGVEVKPGETTKVDVEVDTYLHVSQAALGEAKKDKGSDNTLLWAHVDGRKILLGTLSDKCLQISYDLVFEREFQLSHTSKNASVHFVGYTTHSTDEELSDYDDDSDEDVPVAVNINGKPDAKVQAPKSALKADGSEAKVKDKSAIAGKSKKPSVEPDSDDDDVSDEDDSDEDGINMDEDDMDGEDDSDDEEESSEDEEEETLKKVESGKKRPAESSKVQAADKKAKFVSPAPSRKPEDGKKGGQTATPHPAKKGPKTSGNADKGNQTPKSAGSASCSICKKSFNGENALQAHNKAKHGTAK